MVIVKRLPEISTKSSNSNKQQKPTQPTPPTTKRQQVNHKYSCSFLASSFVIE
jgi:hypothetical protein